MGLWALRLRKTNGELHLADDDVQRVAGESAVRRKLYKGRPIKVKTRAELLASTTPNYWKYLREDAGDIPAAPPPPAPSEAVPQLEAV